MFEPVHGSAPDIAGKHLQPDRPDLVGGADAGASGRGAAGKAIVDAIETLLRESGPKTRDMGGQAGTADVGTAIAQLVAASTPATPSRN
jgi:tartrate dehydrogenase/decarboxylase/D-malate dehydrogenase